MDSLNRAAHPPFEATLGALLSERVNTGPNHIIIVAEDREITVAELADKAKRAATALNRRGIGPGDPVLTMLRNDPDHLALFLGIALLGAVWVPLDPRGRGPTLAHAIAVAKPVLAVAEREAGSRLQAAAPDVGCPVVTPEMWLADTAVPANDWNAAPAKPDDVRAILFTSGTTGPPKGVMVSERMLMASAAGTALASACDEDDVFLMWEPLHHIGGSQIVTMALVHGVRLVMIERFSAGRFWEQVRQNGITKLHYLGGVPEILLKADPLPNDRDHGVQLAFGGGCRPQIWHAFEERFAISIREVYGMTEASSFTTVNLNGTVGSVGTAVPWFTVELVDESGAPVSDGDVGEIVVSSKHPGLFTPGYLNAPEATARLRKNDRLHTGDLGQCDGEGNLRFIGRATDSLRRRGENISAWEIETALAGCDGVAETAVVGVPAAIGEHDILCFVVMRAGVAFDPKAIAAWCHTALPPHHVPRYWKQVDGFERTPSQRIRKDLLDRSLDDACDMAGDRER